MRIRCTIRPNSLHSLYSVSLKLHNRVIERRILRNHLRKQVVYRSIRAHVVHLQSYWEQKPSSCSRLTDFISEARTASVGSAGVGHCFFCRESWIQGIERGEEGNSLGLCAGDFKGDDYDWLVSRVSY